APSGAGMINPQFNAGRPQAKYPVPYGPPTVEEITKVLVRVHDYLAANTPARFVDRATGAEITDFSTSNPNAMLERGAFNIIGYEWGVTYSGMLLAAETTGDPRFRTYVDTRLKFIAARAPAFRTAAQPAAAATGAAGRGGANPFRSLLNPRALDDAGSMAAAMIKAQRAGI